MQYIQDIQSIYDEQEQQGKRCLVVLPHDSRTYILDDYEEGWDWCAAQTTDETEITLVERDTLILKHLTFGNNTRIIHDKNHIRILEDRIEDQVQQVFEEAKEESRPVALKRLNDLGTLTDCELIYADEDRSMVFVSARYENYDNLQILVLTTETILSRSDDDSAYILDGEYFVNSTTIMAPKNQRASR